MRNKRLIVLAALVCAALATAGIAMAVIRTGGVAADSATFNAAPAWKISKSCTVNGGDTYTYTRAAYKGTSVSADVRLNGRIKLVLQSMVDDTTGIGALIGDYTINGGAVAAHGSFGRIEASLSGGQMSGSVRGHVLKPWGELFAGLNGGFTASGGFTNANLGTGSGSDTGVVLSQGACVHVIYLH
jgi:hypothetical protein